MSGTKLSVRRVFLDGGHCLDQYSSSGWWQIHTKLFHMDAEACLILGIKFLVTPQVSPVFFRLLIHFIHPL